ncbi:hypothetical protein BC834DRAFT_537468 [Gloeopeniophorella convolvens]|nr:hypothetical protein BC834DRAFT_537468 [Gloeopeniophorella convolvens]
MSFVAALPKLELPNALWQEGYSRCLALESWAGSQPPQSLGAIPCIVSARALGYLVLKAPGDNGRSFICSEMQECGDETALVTLAEGYIKNLILPLMHAVGHPEAPEQDIVIAELQGNVLRSIFEAIEPFQPGPGTAKILALMRDHSRCAVTGAYDEDDLERFNTLRHAFALEPGAASSKTRAAYIIPPFLAAGIDPTQPSTIVRSHEILACYGGIDLAEIAGEHVHSTRNVLTMVEDARRAFYKLLLFFDETATPGRYKLNLWTEIHRPGGKNIPDYVQFGTTPSEKLPPPSLLLLRLHAACARVAHMAGVGQWLNNTERLDLHA